MRKIVTIIFLLLSIIGFSQSAGSTAGGYGALRYQTFAATTTWVGLPGVGSVAIQCWGGGAAGGGGTGSPSGGGGGTGGGYAKKNSLTVANGTSYTVTVGALVNGSTGAGSNGNPSWFSTSGTVFAPGGIGGGVATVNSTSAAGGTTDCSTCIGDVTKFGGNGGTGSSGASAGGGGQGASSTANGGNGGVTSGGSSCGDCSTGGDGGIISGNGGAGNFGGSPGSGGGGGRAGNATDRAGGGGQAGQVIIEYRTTHLGFM